MADHEMACTSQDHSPPIVIKSEPDVKLPQDVLASSPLVKLIVAELASGEMDTLIRLAAYSSSPPPLIVDRPESSMGIEEATPPDDVRSLRNQLELSTYEYAALEERYCTLQTQHSEIRKLGQALDDVIYGTSSYEDQAVSIEQLRADAGHEGLRAKAVKLNIIRPIIRGAGGLQLMTTQAQSIRSLIEEAGSLEELRALVSDARKLRALMNSFGGRNGSSGDIVSQVQSMRNDQQELLVLKAQLDEPDGLRAKVQKYSRLQQAFYAIETGVAFESTQRSQHSAYPLAPGAKIPVVATGRRQQEPNTTVGMNPARAQLLMRAPVQDPNRDLYEPQPPVTNPREKTGSNDVPLGPNRAGTRSQDLNAKTSGKRQHVDEERMMNIAKRPRIDIGRASALVKATLAPSNAKFAAFTSNGDHAFTPSDDLPLDYGENEPEAGKMEDPGFVRFMQQVTSVQTDTNLAPSRIDRASVESLFGQAQQYDRPLIKQEETYSDACTRTLGGSSLSNVLGEGRAGVLIAGYPIALWVGGKKAANYNPGDLIKTDAIPYSLAKFLAAELTKHLTPPKLEMLKMMPANPGTCILRNLLNGSKPSDLAQNFRACGPCTTESAIYGRRPCALLRDIEGVRTVVFLPLRAGMQQNATWDLKEFWV